ncbi:nuclear transport factor 2 family protein [Amycolatopsis sp. NBC_01480]|uniref:nuclear transport factor 2 family protein n=1 Tax=Amycolatopsis sp. NBC_01480 TaxID=2903562 RepID=UPI002E298CD3|nr:nuclear transport factor 2 family protein [Amycolatopsis sp. NBC_01480]
MNQQGLTRRTMLRNSAVAGAAAAAAFSATGLFTAGTARAATTTGGTLPYPAGVTDTSHCTPEVAAIFRDVFSAKSRHDAAGFLSHFSTTNTVYIDASLGVAMTSWQDLSTFFTPFFATLPAAALSYPLRIVGDTCSAAIEFMDTPEFFQQEIRALSTVTFDRNRKIVRWVDFWDGRSSLKPNTIGSTYPSDFGDAKQNVSPAVVKAAQALQAAFAAGNAAAAVSLMSDDVVHEDMATHTRLRGKPQAQRYYARALGKLPYGPGAAVVHVAGGGQGGGYEWSAGSVAAPLRRGHTCIELDQNGKISRLSAIYDASLFSEAAYQSLVGLAAEAPLTTA